jgi:hypothetical protein
LQFRFFYVHFNGSFLKNLNEQSASFKSVVSVAMTELIVKQLNVNIAFFLGALLFEVGDFKAILV